MLEIAQRFERHYTPACEAQRLKKYLDRIGETPEIWRRRKLKKGSS